MGFFEGFKNFFNKYPPLLTSGEEEPPSIEAEKITPEQMREYIFDNQDIGDTIIHIHPTKQHMNIAFFRIGETILNIHEVLRQNLDSNGDAIGEDEISKYSKGFEGPNLAYRLASGLTASTGNINIRYSNERIDMTQLDGNKEQ